MHIWILFLWLTGSRVSQPVITSQEFDSHEACVKAALAIRKQFEDDAGFLCIEKNPPLKTLSKKKAK